MSEWGNCSIGSGLHLIIDYRGFTPPKSPQGIPLISAANVKGGKLDFSKKSFIGESDYQRLATRGYIAPGDLIITTEAPAGEVALLPSDKTYQLSRRVMALRADESQWHNKFLFYSLLNPRTKTRLLAANRGTTVPRVLKTDITDFEIPCPSIVEQEAIAEVLSSLDDKIDLLKRQNKTLEGMAETLFRQWFIEEAQDDWEEVELHTIADNVRQVMKPEDVGSELKLVGLEHFDSKSLVLGRFQETEELGSQKYRFKQGQILFGKLRPYFHNIALPFFDGVCSTDILVIEAKESDWRLFTFFFLNQDWVVDAATQSASGTRMPRTNWKFLGSLRAQVPGVKVLSEFNSVVEPLVSKMEKNWLEIGGLVRQRDMLLPKLMSGEVRVKMAS